VTDNTAPTTRKRLVDLAFDAIDAEIARGTHLESIASRAAESIADALLTLGAVTGTPEAGPRCHLHPDGCPPTHRQRAGRAGSVASHEPLDLNPEGVGIVDGKLVMKRHE
jgi:hypothetical protein